MSCCSARRKIKRYEKKNKIYPKLSNDRPISRKYQSISSEDISSSVVDIMLLLMITPLLLKLQNHFYILSIDKYSCLFLADLLELLFRINLASCAKKPM